MDVCLCEHFFALVCVQTWVVCGLFVSTYLSSSWHIVLIFFQSDQQMYGAIYIFDNGLTLIIGRIFYYFILLFYYVCFNCHNTHHTNFPKLSFFFILADELTWMLLQVRHFSLNTPLINSLFWFSFWPLRLWSKLLHDRKATCCIMCS